MKTKGLFFFVVLMVFFAFLFANECKKKEVPKETVAEKVSPPVPPEEILKMEAEKEREAKEADLKARIDKLVPVHISVDSEVFDKEWMKPVLAKLIKAADIMDELFLLQVDPGNIMLWHIITHDDTYVGRLTNALFKTMYGRWDRFDENKPFYTDKKKPLGAGFYPEDLTKEEFEKWVKEHPKDKEAFESFFTVIMRTDDGLKAVPYSEFYSKLTTAAQLLIDASNLSKNKKLTKYLRSRARAFLDNQYRESDMDWMDLGDCPIDPIIGPYEVYEDELLGLKAAFEAIITIRDPQGSEQLQKFLAYMPEWQKNLPIPDKYKKFPLKKSPLTVVSEIYAAGDGKKPPTAVALMLPNDPEVWKAKGSKKMMIKNVMKAKFDNCTLPISKRVLTKEQQSNVTFEAYFNFVLGHELGHGLLPPEIEVKGQKTTTNKALKEIYGTIEEARADLMGVWMMQYLVDKGVFPKDYEKKIYAVALNGTFRSARFGEAHAKGKIAIFNYMRDRIVYYYTYSSELGFSVDDYEKAKTVFTELLTKLYMFELTGDYQGAKDFLEKYGKIDPSLQAGLEKIKDIPIDILPIYNKIFSQITPTEIPQRGNESGM